jgi:hypothetical protein
MSCVSGEGNVTQYIQTYSEHFSQKKNIIKSSLAIKDKIIRKQETEYQQIAKCRSAYYSSGIWQRKKYQNISQMFVTE